MTFSDYGWTVENTILQFRDRDGKVTVPGADAIYGCVFERKKIEADDGTAIPSPEKSTDLEFSRYPLRLSVAIISSLGDRLGVRLALIGKHQDAQHDISELLIHPVDHIIRDQKWFPVLPGQIDSVRARLTELGIQDGKNLRLQQYLELAHGENEDLTVEVEAERIQLEPYAIETPLFKGTLYPYQKDGFRWLSLIAEEHIGGILADEMGLGKTVQVIALFAREKARGKGPFLVIAPATLLENWRREIVRFAPELSVYTHRGPDRTGFPSYLRDRDVVLVSYGTIIRDQFLFEMIEWRAVVLDEAQAIKNPEAKRTEAVKKLPRDISIAMTGTPVENRLTDLWSITDFALPGYLGSLDDFEERFPSDQDGASLLEPVVAPIMLRRRVSQVADDLPERIDVPQVIGMDAASSQEYEAVRKKTAQEYESNAGLVALNRLRMFCTHPFLVNDRTGDPARYSAKYRRLVEILEEIFQNGRKVLIFTSFLKMSDILSEDLRERFGIFVKQIDGRTDQEARQPVIDSFSSIDQPAALVLNPRAAGTGLNITAANHVIHYNPEWNPAIEDQASARAYRRGQDRPVTVHRLYFADTIEDVMSDRLHRKRTIADAALIGAEGDKEDYGDMMEALRRSPVGSNNT